jgi:glycosyltransferase involved in cell wall biosynthesis
MRALLTVPDLDPASGGLPAAALGLAAALIEAGHAVALVYSADAARAHLPLPAGVAGHAVVSHRNPWTLHRRWQTALAGFIRSWRPQVLHDHGLWRPENAAAQRVAVTCGIPLIAQPCGMLQRWSMQQKSLKKRLAWALYQRALVHHAAAIITTSADEHAETQPWLRAGQPVVEIPHGVDMSMPDPAPPRLRRAVFLGRLHPKKQVDLLIRLWLTLRPAGWQLVIAGSGETQYEQHLRALVAAGGPAAAIHFAGPVLGRDKQQLLASSQLFLQPSLQENFGLAVAEALTCGLPALTTRDMPWTQLPTLGAGWSVGSDTDSIEAALRQALALDAPTLAAMGARAQKLAADYGWASCATKTAALYARYSAA